MLPSERAPLLKAVAAVAMGACFVLALYGYFEHETDPEDKQRQELYVKAFQAGDIKIWQPTQGAPLEAAAPQYSELRPDRQRVYEKERWDRLRQQVFRFVGVVNQGLGDPFEYPKVGDKDYPGPGEPLPVKGIKETSLRYQNPFEASRTPVVTTPISSSQVVAADRHAWRIVSKDILLLLKPGDGDPVNVSPGAKFVCEVGPKFLLASSGNPNLQLSVYADDVSKSPGVRLALQETKGGRKNLTPEPLQHGSHFIWDGRPFAIFRTDVVVGDAADTSIGDLVFTKMINGQPARVQVLGRATANLIGSPVGGSTPYVDGAFRHGSGQRLVLTIDPEIQTEASFLLHRTLDELSKHATKMESPRKGSITVIDSRTGGILAQAGAPGYDPQWEGKRIILANRQRLIENPANEVHMPGSTIKVLTSGVGYLLFREGAGKMLPESINQLAIRQAFRDAYGGGMPPENIVENTKVASVTEAGQKYFEEHGTKSHLNQDFVSVLDAGFNVLSYKPDDNDVLYGESAERAKYYDSIVPKPFERYFDPRASLEFSPIRSRFPMRDADSMKTFRLYAIGASEARFTTLRLAAMLETASSGREMQPSLVESIFDPALDSKEQRITYRPADVFTELRDELRDLEPVDGGSTEVMKAEMQKYLRQVCDGEPGTGFYYNADGKKVYMTADDPQTDGINEGATRKGDFGKTGTADYGELDYFNDSAFTYKHGRYLIAIWLDRAEGKGITHPAHRLLNQLLIFIDKLEPPDGQ
ncbi:MAG TPA: penicillin-binding transpeptidase domain-containing protein [Pyrinomonadaceae bacterium]|jgi:hypothetical protein